MADKRTVPVVIQGQEYRIRSDAGESLIRRAASMVDATMGKLRTRTSTADTQDVAVLAALNIANQLIASQDRPAGSRVEATPGGKELGPLIEMVEQALSDDGVAPH